jgi:hypothetical protein
MSDIASEGSIDQGEKLLTAGSAIAAEFTLYRPILSKAVDCALLVRVCIALFSHDKFG